MSPSRNNYLRLGAPKFVADEGSVMLHGTGLQIDWDDVSAQPSGIKKLSAGTLVHIKSSNGKIRPAVATTYPSHGILVADVDNQRGQNNAMHGVYRGGIFYENLLPAAPDGTQKTELGPRFVFQVYQDSRLD